MPALDAVVRAWLPLDPPPPSLAALVPWAPLMALNGALVGGLAAAALLLRARSRRRPSPRTVTWDCGYARPSPRMAYTASSFAQILVGLFGWLLQPRFESAVASELFPARRHFHVSVPEQVLDGVLAPLWTGFRRALVPLRALQHGRIQRYLMVVFLTLCALLAFQVPLDRLLARLFAW
jgi:hydrogenase-4 component B